MKSDLLGSLNKNLPEAETGKGSYRVGFISSGFLRISRIDDYAKDGGEEIFTKMLCALIANP